MNALFFVPRKATKRTVEKYFTHAVGSPLIELVIL